MQKNLISSGSDRIYPPAYIRAVVVLYGNRLEIPAPCLKQKNLSLD